MPQAFVEKTTKTRLGHGGPMGASDMNYISVMISAGYDEIIATPCVDLRRLAQEIRHRWWAR